MTLLPPTDPESFADIGPGIWESIGYKVQDSLPLYVPRLASPSWIIFVLCFELEQIGDHIYYTNGGYSYSKCGLGFALAQSIKKFILCGQISCSLILFWENLVKNISIPKIG